MRLLLDANLSPKRIGAALTGMGHDVLCLAADPALGSLDDPNVLELAAEQERVLITRNSRDFAPLLRTWAEGDRHHAGCILIWTLGHHQFGMIVRAVAELLEGAPDQDQWRDFVAAV